MILSEIATQKLQDKKSEKKKEKNTKGKVGRPKLRMSQPNQDRSDPIEVSRPRRSGPGQTSLLPKPTSDQDLRSWKLSKVIARYNRCTPVDRNLNIWPSVLHHRRPSKVIVVEGPSSVGVYPSIYESLPIEKPLAHLKKFLRFVDMPLLDGAITTWDKCIHKFLLKYFPLSKSNKLKKDIMNFSQFK
ncbi:hypothetical protein CR513_15188, partial [Mucuna pruriens]